MALHGEQLRSTLLEDVCSLCGTQSYMVTPNDTLEMMNVDSLRRAQLQGVLELYYGAKVDPDAVDEKAFVRVEAIILSMTKEERLNPKLLNPSRKQRIARGSGSDIAEVNRLVKQFEQMQKLMKQMGGMMGKKNKGLFGGLPGMGGGNPLKGLKLPF